MRAHLDTVFVHVLYHWCQKWDGVRQTTLALQALSKRNNLRDHPLVTVFEQISMASGTSIK